MTPPSISVVIPCFNAAAFLTETLQSALSQTLAPQEVIVVDDGSTDESARIAESFGPPVRVIRQTNHGESVARNRGIEQARGTWIALLDADDRWEPNKLERQVAALSQAPPETVCCYTITYRFRGEERLDLLDNPEYDQYPNPVIQMLIDWCVAPSSALVRTDVARATRFPENIRRQEDLMFFAHVRTRGPFVKVREPLTGYRVSPAQQTGSPRHVFESLMAKCEWFTDHRSLFSDGDEQTFRASVRADLERAFERAFWRRETALARECRTAYRRLFPQDTPKSMQRLILPAWLYRLKDSVAQPTARLFL